MIVFFVAIVVIAILLYLGTLYFQKSFQKQINSNQEELEKLTESELEKKIKKIKSLHLTGESLSEFEEVQKNYKHLVKRVYPEISEMILDLNELNEKYKFYKEKTYILEVNTKLETAKEKQHNIEKMLEKIEQRVKEHQEAVEELNQKYKNIRKTLLAKNFSYGPSIDKLEEKLVELENNFDAYSEITKSGDYVSSDHSLNELRDATAEMEKNLEDIPPVYKNIKTTFPTQLNELKDAVTQMSKQGFAFPRDISAQLKELEEQLQINEDNLKNLEISNAKVLDKDIADKIDGIYEVLEDEYTARQKVQKKIEMFGKFINHAQKQERNLLTDLNRLKQNYTLNHDELEEAQGLQERINGIQSWFEKYLTDSKDKLVQYSLIAEKMDNDIKTLTKIEEKQKAINNSVSNLWKEEKDARAAIQNFDVELHRMKRELQKLNLPGLSNEFLDFMYKVNDEIDDLDVKLNQEVIDIDEITKDLINTQSDLDILGEKTDEIIANATLAEEILQYANRYRNSNNYPELAEAYSQAATLFNTNFDYTQALDIIAEAVDQIEQGKPEQIMDAYYQTHQKLFSK